MNTSEVDKIVRQIYEKMGSIVDHKKSSDPLVSKYWILGHNSGFDWYQSGNLDTCGDGVGSLRAIVLRRKIVNRKVNHSTRSEVMQWCRELRDLTSSVAMTSTDAWFRRAESEYRHLGYLGRASQRFQQAFEVVTKTPYYRAPVRYEGKNFFEKCVNYVEKAIKKCEKSEDYQRYAASHSYDESYSTMFMLPSMQKARDMILILFNQYCDFMPSQI